MKKAFIIIEAMFLVSAFTIRNEDISTICFVAFLLFPILFAGYCFSKRSKDKVKNYVAPQPTTYQDYLWLQNTDDVGNQFFKAYKDELEESDDYHMTKKEILDEYYDGGKIYKYEPFSLPFKVENGKVYSYIKQDEWICVGTIKKREIAKYEQSIKTELCLMPNYFKVVDDDSVITDSGDSYFGLSVILP